ncbi:MAG: methyltransferase domain-containing protein [Acidobacteria bacterium]|nr:MAG: methyltransferase domain-containing protein [Acidobacteriota bacterium]
MDMAATPTRRRRFTFDRQARSFDRRAGLPPGVAQRVAAAVVELLAAARPRGAAGGGLLLELGAGTGEIGAELALRAPRYVGFDLSPAMLARFRRRRGRPRSAWLVAADGDATWPFRDRTARLIFASRAAHLLAPEPLVGEILRLADDAGALLVAGRVRRAPISLRDELRRELRRRLAARGVEARRGGASLRRLRDALVAHGGEPLPPRVVAAWEVVERPDDALAAWRAKDGLAGVALEPELRRAVLDELAAWARTRYGALAYQRTSEERYELAAIRLPARREDRR